MVISESDVIQGTLKLFSAYTPLIQIWTGICLLFFYVDLLSHSPLKGIITSFNDKTYKVSEILRNRIQGVIFDKHFTLTDNWEGYKSRVKNMAAITFFYCLFILFLIGLYRFNNNNPLFSEIFIVSVDFFVIIYLITCNFFDWKIFHSYLTPIIYITSIIVMYFCEAVYFEKIDCCFIELCGKENSSLTKFALRFFEMALCSAILVNIIMIFKVILTFRRATNPRIRNFTAATVCYVIVLFTLVGFCIYHFKNGVDINSLRSILINSIIILSLLFFCFFNWTFFRKYLFSAIFLVTMCLLYILAIVYFKEIMNFMIFLCTKQFTTNEISFIVASLSFATCVLGLLLVILHICRDFIYVVYNFILAIFINSRIQKIYTIASKYILLSPEEFNKKFVFDADLPKRLRNRSFSFYKDRARKNSFNIEEMQGNQLIDYLINQEFDSYLHSKFLKIVYIRRQKEKALFSIDQENQLGTVIDNHLTSFFNKNDFFLRAQLKIGSTLYRTKVKPNNNNKKPKRKH